jgi:hypothetical protein
MWLSFLGIGYQFKEYQYGESATGVPGLPDDVSRGLLCRRVGSECKLKFLARQLVAMM